MSPLQRRAFLVASWAMILTAGLHFLGNLQGPPPPSDETEAQLFKLMATYEKDIMGVRRTTLDFLSGFSHTFSIFLVYGGLLNLLVLRQSSGDAAFMRRLALLNAAFSLVMLVISVVFFVPPPTVCFAVILAGFVTASV